MIRYFSLSPSLLLPLSPSLSLSPSPSHVEEPFALLEVQRVFSQHEYTSDDVVMATTQDIDTVIRELLAIEPTLLQLGPQLSGVFFFLFR